ncbi:NAD/NADP-dependent betaine aldehyde dehydrogenase [Cupriavidus yeoncheonensis]|uniref:NAD/NADP-dependent betaine aldehyde dehydrogenase n=1 Tax=Cupriavidus yeoncheonensis TaxID=1462994 RepID=A0A916J169_9BURK|nr:aldehyde dehydrogenase family protein [Cupriavidus yeoncheonensis]CAG2153842.1 NAD/NADP-dependent betaine aldehyde dehydrogenase [Cupriavidus yeoncheonensis]
MTTQPQALPSLSLAAEAFFARREFGLIIDGQSVPAASGETLETFNPSTGEGLARIAAGDAADVDRAVRAARAAFNGPWAKWSPYDRQALLFRAHALIDQRFDELAEIEAMDMGAPISKVLATKASMQRSIGFFASQALSIRGETAPNGLPGEVTTMTVRGPAGVIGGIIPWNGPLGSQWWIIGAVLATGCTAVLKPSEEASLSVLRMVELLNEIGVPPGVLNVVTGKGSKAGEALAAHPDVNRIAFTGSTETGRKIIRASTVNIKKLQLELGGKSPDIIFADADLDKAVVGAANGVFNNSGQICFAGTRVLVQRSIVEQFSERVAAYAKTLRLGRSLDRQSQLGPLISSSQLDVVKGYIDAGKREGADLVCGGDRPDDLGEGYFLRPTVFTNVNNEMKIAREEIFGPVMSIIPFDSADEAIAIGNATEYGLGGGVWTRDVSTALRVANGIQSGVMWVNCYGLIDPVVGFTGAKTSGYGAKGTSAHLDTYLQTKSIYIQV